MVDSVNLPHSKRQTQQETINHQAVQKSEQKQVPHSQRQQNQQAAKNWLINTFPNTFFKPGGKIKPLKLGIHKDLQKHYKELKITTCSFTSIRRVLERYCSSNDYITALVTTGSPRIDLSGEIVGNVTEAEAIQAQKEKLKRKMANKNANIEKKKT